MNLFLPTSDKWGQISQVNRKRECEFLGGPPHPGWGWGHQSYQLLPRVLVWCSLIPSPNLASILLAAQLRVAVFYRALPISQWEE